MSLLDRIRGSDRDRFARRVLDRVRAHGVAKAWYDAEQFTVEFQRGPDDPGGSVFLGNIFRECQGADRAERDERIGRLVEAVMNTPPVPQDWVGVKPLLRTVLRVATYGLGAPDSARPLLWRPALPYLIELVGIDMPTALAYVTLDKLDEWGVTAFDVYDAARANLAELDRDREMQTPDQPALIRFVDDGNGYFISRLMLPGWLASLAPHVGGTPVAFIPDNHTVLVGSDDPGLLEQLFPLAEEEYRQASRPLSPVGYTVDLSSGAVVPYTAGPSARRACALLASGEYQSESEFLMRDEDVYVANLLVAESPHSGVFTVASWARDVDTLLPRADYVAFSSEQDSPWFVPFDVAMAEAGLQPESPLRLERFRARQWPAPEVMQRLRALAESP
ncbi:hypothetical protein [Allorhizocola rhizosphaerae]|uniref:hypothetical protein n=1 Tax=Allorhizocola rhizosphaerae TaxID=1872709 RepID=UPI000E3BD4D9|nr:hypothetical protein [Allorhizocola rhizosphaerae]